MGLATEHAPGVWELSERMEPALRELGERGDIIRNMHKALKADGLERDPMTFQIHDAAPEARSSAASSTNISPTSWART
jgi:type IV secretory pathway VirD2 relaxase